MQPAIESLRNTLRLPTFEKKVLDSLQLVRALEREYLGGMEEEWFTQAVRGFINVTLEAAEDGGHTLREMFFATIVPGVLAEGQVPAEVLIRSSTTFLNLLGSQLLLETEQGHQKDAAVWFATFAGSYMQDLYQACNAEPTS